ncbi:rhodanese-like domain-containing protein [Flavitalea sp. BT771]|uniref:rhodanese-like domain-containing protein n=1 Tax=Flavitalea sp. BT771 TaxID=3063329 RepID=UPI0026E21BFD|nr:rhodanese-like domain-containing protein [Flavitalea sp. BT771]MDO6430354.1 rhodanese-like domain-containing protein [Flavitalea sp. BT771]MDV6219506.1 rhodanese-like domain-containing protein [Flavitalea sp. BT771]
MNKRIFFATVLALSFWALAVSFMHRQAEPWRQDQLMPPAELAEAINHPSADTPLIICVGPAGPIKGSIETGPAAREENLNKLKKLLSKENKDREIVIYCGCCPFKNCPNVRPAFTLLNTLQFTRHKLLDLPHNIKVDWINPGYPTKE